MGPGGPDGSAAVVRVAWTPGRAEPDHRSEMTTQWMCGQVLEPLEEEERWLRVRGPDGYASWVGTGSVLRPAAPEAEAWREEATAFSLGVRLEPGDADVGRRRGRDAAPRRLPWGARAVPEGPGAVRLPDGTAARVASPDRLVEPAEARRRFPPEPSAVVRTGLRWVGAPYVWGGRAPGGTDCSGLVQAVHALHGADLPRDSGQQLRAGPGIAVPELAPGDAGSGGAGGRRREPDAGAREDAGSRPGDLLFFGDDASSVSHVAVVVEGAAVLHAAEENGAVAVDDLSADRPLAERLRRRLVGATRPLASA